jgi:Arylsulfotransferase (ASST)
MLPPRLLLAALVGGSFAAASPAAAAVTVSPQPGTPTASYRTQLSFRGLAPGQVRGIRVTGSRSGRHTGRVRAHSDGQGASLVFGTAFRRGESVLVETSLDIAGARGGDYRFKVAATGNASKIVFVRLPPTRLGAGLRDRFHSRPDLAPPAVSITRDPRGTAPGQIFLNGRNRTGRGQQGPMIVDDRGDLLWFRPTASRKATDVRVQEYRGAPVLTFWEGLATQGAGSGEAVIADQAYKTVARVRAGNGYRLDLHEFRLTPRGTALVTIYNPLSRDLSSLGGSSRGKVVDAIVQEIDVKTGLVLFEWHSLGRVGLTESYDKPARSSTLYFDYFHLNSVAEDTDGNLLISGRDTWAVYKVDRGTGEIMWRLNGKKSDFKMGAGAEFAYQHNVQRRADGALSIFDNSAAPPVRKESRALVVSLDEKAKQATLVHAYTHPPGLSAANQGSVQTLPNGDVFVGWGSQRAFSEFTPDGRLVFDARLSAANDSYRVARHEWVGHPSGPPRAAVERRSRGRTAVFASFNGSTEVARWSVLGGDGPRRLKPLVTAPRRGFETGIPLSTAPRYVVVRALAADGRTLGTSRAYRRR